MFNVAVFNIQQIKFASGGHISFVNCYYRNKLDRIASIFLNQNDNQIEIFLLVVSHSLGRIDSAKFIFITKS